MELKMIGKERDRISFTVKDTTPAFMNAMRRLMIDEVPTMAIKTVNFVKNTSALYDEMIAHRLGLVVLKTDLEGYELPDQCKCGGKGCARCTADITLQAEGPCVVYAESLKVKDPKVKPVHPKTIIARLAKNQSLELEAKAVLGRGKDHVKFSPGLVYYHGHPIIKVNPREDTSAAVKACPKKVFTLDGKKAVVSNLLACDLNMACVDAVPDGVTVEESSTDFVMFIEPWGQLKPKEMVEQAVIMMDEKCDAFTKALKSLK